jgi:predicted molibdopterin-dependent oxidoreductase YjgC
LTYRLLYDAGSRISRTGGIGELTPPAFAEINITDAQARNVGDGQQVTLSSAHGSITVTARVSKEIRAGAVFVPWNQPGATAQALCALDDRYPSIDVSPA